MIEKQNVFDIPISIFSTPQLKECITEIINTNDRSVLYGFSLYTIYQLNICPDAFLIGRKADILVTDGRPFFWMLKFFRVPLKSTISIPESVMLTLNIANQNGFSVMLLGATEEINKIATKNISTNYPNIRVLDGQNGYFDFEIDLNKVIEKINKKAPDILLIGMQSPIKEKIAIEYKYKLSCKLIIPCGGMIDVLANKTKQTPKWLKQIGLASIYRIVQEPKRLLVDRLKFYSFIFFNFLPLLFYNIIVLNKKNFSLIEHYLNAEK